MRDRANVGIVGAGPAGARAAELLAAQGADVVLLDPRVPWEKPCGGGLTPVLFDDIPELAEIQPLARPVDLARVELGSEIGFEVRLERPIWIVAREHLGRWQLQRAVAAGAEHVPSRVSAITRTAAGWLLETDDGELRVETLVGADGAASIVRRATGCGLRLDPLVARVEYPQEQAPVPDGLVLRFFPGVVGYLWDFPRLDHRSVGMELTSGSASRAVVDPAIDEYLETTGWHPSGRVRSGAVIGTARLRPRRFSRIAGDHFALVGDAAGLADPFTGEGIRNAFRSAGSLATAHASGGADWTRTYARLVRRELAVELAVAGLLRRILSESRVGVSLIERAVDSEPAYAFVGAMLDALSAHDYGAGHFARRWLRRRRTGRRLHRAAAARHGERAMNTGAPA